jgi:hypothetical protein
MRLVRAFVIFAFVAVLPFAASAQTQVKPRVLLMVDTSGSMASHLADDNISGGDGSIAYVDNLMERSTTATPGFALYEGFRLDGPICTGTGTYDGINSRLFNAKIAVANVINGSGDIDWGLMRYTGMQCAIVDTISQVAVPSGKQPPSNLCTTAGQCLSGNCSATGVCTCTSNAQCLVGTCRNNVCGCTNNSQCGSGFTCTNNQCIPNSGTCTGRGWDQSTTGTTRCICTNDAECGLGRTCQNERCVGCGSDNDCPNQAFCDLTGSTPTPNRCFFNNNLCNVTNQYGFTDTRGVNNTCGNHANVGLSYTGSCGDSDPNSNQSSVCRDPQVCYSDTDCAGTAVGRCKAITGTIGSGGVGYCECGQANEACPANYLCETTGANTNKCVFSNGCQSVGGEIIVDPVVPNSNLAILPYVDLIEVNKPGALANTVVNPELRANGNTPLAGAARTATDWYKKTIAGDASASKLCRPYVLVQMTDGEDTCDNNQTTGPIAAAGGFVTATVPGARIPNKVYVIGLAFTDPNQQTHLNDIAKAGGTGAARFANSQAGIEAALADIVASSVLSEQCNGQDDDCNQLVDDGLGVYQECKDNQSCGNGTCDQGRCPCNGAAGANQCATGFVCNNPGGPGFCVPSCTVGTGECQVTGVKKCSGACCVNDGSATCTPLTAGTGATEICNGKDDNCNGIIDDPPVCQTCNPTSEVCDGRDNDCDGIIDNNLVDIGLACGLDDGECTAGVTQCVPTSGAFPNDTDHLVCTGQGPVPEGCDNKDNDCDGIVDGIIQACYTGSPATRGQGICRDGEQQCTAGSFGACVGQVLPGAEVCNNLDDDCDGTIDDVAGAGATCCPSGNCGVGQCQAGMVQCSGSGLLCVGAIGPSTEICDGIDNDCNGQVDDLPIVGNACTPAAGCGGTFQCNLTTHTVECVPGAPQPEICDGIDNNCNGVIDEDAEVSANDPRIGADCDAPPPPQDQPPCKPGKTVCQFGSVVCEGAIKPQPNQCDGVSRDCTGLPNDNGNCQDGFICYQGNCLQPCGSGEFPCPGGFVCITDNNQNRVCAPDVCTNVQCPDGQFCQADANNTAVCVDPCDRVNCPDGYRCKAGVCVDNSCKVFGCQDGEMCEGSPPTCVPDPCFNVSCDPGLYCMGGECVRPCAGPCPTGENCFNGECVADPCTNTHCVSGEVCAVVSGVGMCVSDSCGSGCGSGTLCCGGACVADPCQNVECPGRSTCQVDSSCRPSCVAPPPEQIVGAGGGGFSCQMASGHSNSRNASGEGLLLASILALGLFRRRRSLREGGL